LDIEEIRKLGIKLPALISAKCRRSSSCPLRSVWEQRAGQGGYGGRCLHFCI